MKVSSTSSSSGSATSWFSENKWFLPTMAVSAFVVGSYALVKWATTPTVVKGGGGGGGIGGLLGGIVDAIVPL